MSSGTPSSSRNAAFARKILDSGIFSINLPVMTSHPLFVGAHMRIRHEGDVRYTWSTASHTTNPVLDEKIDLLTVIGPSTRYGTAFWWFKIWRTAEIWCQSRFESIDGSWAVRRLFLDIESGKRKFLNKLSEAVAMAWCARFRQTLLKENLTLYLHAE